MLKNDKTDLEDPYAQSKRTDSMGSAGMDFHALQSARKQEYQMPRQQ